jgi:prepilin-type N-terminal cleavage/methylation domain-containing protein
MAKTTKNQQRGFTVIEVVLVIAVAGLIFLMVFIAAPAMRRAQRNAKRKDDMSHLLTAIQDYADNNDGETPFMNIPNESTKDKAKETIRKFVNRYVVGDNSCYLQDYQDTGTADIDLVTDNGTSARYKFGGCSEAFVNPDGVTYGLDVRYTNNSPNGNSNQTIVLHGKNTDGESVARKEVTHWITIYQSAHCSERAGEVIFHGKADESYSSSKQINAIVYRLEGGAMSCVDNR